MIAALFPPNYSKLFPNLSSTVLFTIFPILVDPVNDTRGTLLSLAIA
jgi:hypothetical protein